MEWLPCNGTDPYTVFCRPRGEDTFTTVGQTAGTEFDITGLASDRDYEFYVMTGSQKSRVRLARTGACVGTVINYLHPDDGAYAFSGHYLCSPSLVKHPDGYLLASMDVFAGTYPQNLTLIFRSDDGGESWHYVSELFPCFWGKMFIHDGALYMAGVSTEYGDLLIGRSEDCKEWHAAWDEIDMRGIDSGAIGFQYVSMEIDGKDLIYQCRTAMNGAHNYHDTNYATFHRVSDFRKKMAIVLGT